MFSEQRSLLERKKSNIKREEKKKEREKVKHRDRQKTGECQNQNSLLGETGIYCKKAKTELKLPID
jgi:hypothetical protein